MALHLRRIADACERQALTMAMFMSELQGELGFARARMSALESENARLNELLEQSNKNT